MGGRLLRHFRIAGWRGVRLYLLYFVGAAQTDALGLVAVPVRAIAEVAVISVAACLLATAIPLRAIARMAIVDSIETVE